MVIKKKIMIMLLLYNINIYNANKKKTYIFHLFKIILEFFVLLRLFGTIFVNFFEPLADIFLMLLAALVEVDTRFIIGDPALAEVAELAALGLPIVCPAIRYRTIRRTYKYHTK